MQRAASSRGRFVTLWTALLLAGPALSNASSCTFPEKWAGKWFQKSVQSIITINTTNIEDKKCVEKEGDMYLIHESPDNCFRCMIINDRHENVVQYREGPCDQMRRSLGDYCYEIPSDDNLVSLFRLDAKPIACPFNGLPFTFYYNSGYGDCKLPENQAESCTDESKILLKYQGCPDISGSESKTEELQCLATWKDGRNNFLVGTLQERSKENLKNEDKFRCFIYGSKMMERGKMEYRLAQSGDASCNGLTNPEEGSRVLRFMKMEKEHVKCKYPSWVTQHHLWHSLDGTQNYHFTIHNSTLKVTYQNKTGSREEKIVCHSIVKNTTSPTSVKLVAHVTNGCDIGYVCMMFHKRDDQIIEVQQSDSKATVPTDACSYADFSKRPYITLIPATLHKKKCPQSGRYNVIVTKRTRRHQRIWPKSKRSVELITQANDEKCCDMKIQIGCNSLSQSEMFIDNNCQSDSAGSPCSGSSFLCHGTWQENGTWFTVMSRNGSYNERQTLCFSMKEGNVIDKIDRVRGDAVETRRELLLSSPASYCHRPDRLPPQNKIATDIWSYRLDTQGPCDDLIRAASSAASSSSVIKISTFLILVAVALQAFFSR